MLVSIDGLRIGRAEEAAQVLARLGTWHKAEYKVMHNGTEVPAPVIIGEVTRDSTLYYQYAVGVVYLAIGLFVYFRRGSAPRALHFFLLCLASFVLSTFHYTGKLNNFDKVIYLGNVVAWFLAPTLFLHFCFSFPDQQNWIRRRGAALAGVSAGAGAAGRPVGIHPSGWLRTSAPLIEMRWLLDRVWLGFLMRDVPGWRGGAGVPDAPRERSDRAPATDLAAQRRAAGRSFRSRCSTRFRTFWVWLPNQAMNLAVLSLPLIPLTWAYAILRYRLMDVDVIFQQGYAYTLATLCVLAIFYGLIFSVSGAGELNGPAMVVMILIAAFVFQPIRKWVQERLDRYFYKDRYDYRRTLVEFARELGSPTDLQAMLESWPTG